MCRKIFITLALSFIATAGFSQFGYTLYQKVDGLKISTKWGKARDADGVKKPALLIATENTNDYAVEYSFELLFYAEGILRETGKIENECLDGLTSRTGKLNGVYFIPQKFTPEQLKSSDSNFEIESITVTKVDNCPNE